MRQIARRERFRSGWVSLMGFGLSLIVGMALGQSGQSRAAQVASDLRRAAGETKVPAGAHITLAELAARVAAERSAQSSSTSVASDTTRVPTSVPGDPLLDPSTYINPIVKSKLVKDLEHLVSISHGKMSNLNQQTVDSLAADLGIRLPRSVAPHLATSGTKGKTAAEGLDLSSAQTGTPRPAPVPEPGTMVIFGLAAFALAARSRLGRRAPGP
jgi:PEP-CTERM motif